MHSMRWQLVPVAPVHLLLGVEENDKAHDDGWVLLQQSKVWSVYRCAWRGGACSEERDGSALLPALWGSRWWSLNNNTDKGFQMAVCLPTLIFTEPWMEASLMFLNQNPSLNSATVWCLTCSLGMMPSPCGLTCNSFIHTDSTIMTRGSITTVSLKNSAVSRKYFWHFGKQTAVRWWR